MGGLRGRILLFISVLLVVDSETGVRVRGRGRLGGLVRRRGTLGLIARGSYGRPAIRLLGGLLVLGFLSSLHGGAYVRGLGKAGHQPLEQLHHGLELGILRREPGLKLAIRGGAVLRRPACPDASLGYQRREPGLKLGGLGSLRREFGALRREPGLKLACAVVRGSAVLRWRACSGAPWGCRPGHSRP